MPTIIQINTTANSGSHGKIAEEIGRLSLKQGWRSIIAYGRWANSSLNELTRIGTPLGVYEHGLESYLLDNHGLASRLATMGFVKYLKELQPDIIHLHNIHGYYLNYKILFEYLSSIRVPVIWTLHDCWSFTGHCSHFDYSGCDLWRKECHSPCLCKGNYPRSILLDRSKRNYLLKKRLFTSIDNLTLVPVSDWLKELMSYSFFASSNIKVIKNGIDLDVFKKIDNKDVRNKYGIGQKKYVLGVASDWKERKGYEDFLKIAKGYSDFITIVLVGLDDKKVEESSRYGIIGIPRTENVKELVALYSGAEMFLNLTYEDNYPTTNLEAMACGTPVLTYSTGGSPEAITKETGWICEKGHLDDVIRIIRSFESLDFSLVRRQREACRKRAEQEFDKNSKFKEYMRLYDSLLNNRL